MYDAVAGRDQLRCVIGIIRHGDRTPKQKMKMIVSHRKFYQFFEEMNGYKTTQIKVKAPQKMQVSSLFSQRRHFHNQKKNHFQLVPTQSVHASTLLECLVVIMCMYNGVVCVFLFLVYSKYWTSPGHCWLILRELRKRYTNFNSSNLSWKCESLSLSHTSSLSLTTFNPLPFLTISNLMSSHYYTDIQYSMYDLYLVF